MHVVLDIDGTITKDPAFFALLSRAVRVAGGKVYVITSRSGAADLQTRRELGSYGIDYDELVFIPEGQDRIPCPHAGLDWYQRYLWQKVHVCLDRDVDVVFEDDEKVITLFHTYAPRIRVFRVT